MGTLTKWTWQVHCRFSLKSIFKIRISGKDSCTGDSGGPLVSREYSDDPWYQVGIRTVPQGNNKKILKNY